ncbi:unnamed protein product, partial [Tetraodon nigroviridis]
ARSSGSRRCSEVFGAACTWTACWRRLPVGCCRSRGPRSGQGPGQGPRPRAPGPAEPPSSGQEDPSVSRSPPLSSREAAGADGGHRRHRRLPQVPQLGPTLQLHRQGRTGGAGASRVCCRSSSPGLSLRSWEGMKHGAEALRGSSGRRPEATTQSSPRGPGSC